MPTTPPDFELRLLGGFEARLGGATVAIASPRMRALLAYLALEPREHGRDTLADLFWGGAPTARARDYLRHDLWGLRRLLEPACGTAAFGGGKHSLRLALHARVDAAVFAGSQPPLADAERMALYRGEFLSGLSLPDCPPFEDWLLARREALHRRALALAEELARRHAQAGNTATAITFALRQVELEPWAEDAQRHLMRLYAENGQPGAALAQYESCSRQLRQELGVLPSEETQALAQSIRQGQLEAAPPPRHPASSAPPPPTRPVAAERRQVSVLYCELVTGAQPDPDEAMELLHAPQARCVDAIREFSGHIVQAHGGGLLAYFGYPSAREDAARHAVQAALAVAQVGAEAHALGIEIRAGVHTGLILTGGDAAMPDSVGKTSRIAIHLRQCLAAGGVAVSEETQAIVSGYFDCVSLGTHALPGELRPREVFGVKGASGARNRLEAATRLTPLVGRKSELAQLSDAWSEAARGQRRMVLLRGEPGIGKSRLALALREHLADRGQPHLLHEMRCFPETAQSPLHPLIAMVESLFGFLPGDPASKLCARLEAYLDAHFSPSKSAAMPLLLALLSLPADPRYPLPDLPPRRLKDATHALLLDLLATEALRQPVLLIVEDLHWIDPSTRELLDLLVAREQPGALLGLFTTRPEFASTWPEHLVTPLPLAPLREVEVAAMVDALVTDLPAAARASIVQRADGIPLFAEEMSKMSRADPNAGVPSTLLDLLASRIDTLGEAKTCAQLAATLGREFDLSLLQAISPQPPALLRQHLHALQEAGLVLPDMHDTGQFKHALIQEAAYQSQAKATRVAAHRRIADALQSRFKDTAAHQPEILAQHLAAGGEPLQAIDYWVMAARRAASLCANLEAAAHFVAALDVAAALPAGPERDGVEFNLRVGLAPVLCATKGYGAQEVARNNARVGELAEVIDDNPALFPAKWAMTIGTIGSVGSRGMAPAVAQLLESARGDPVRQIAAHFLGSNASLWLGDFAACIHHDDQIVALYRPEFQASLVDQFGSDLSVFSADHAGFALWLTGFAEQAQVRMDRALERARAGAHPHTLSQALVFTAVHKRWSGGPETAGEAKALAAQAIEIARHHDMPLWIASAGMTHGWACAMLGDVEAGIAEARDAIAIAREALSAIAVVYIAPLIEVYIHLARHDEALAWVKEAQAQADISGDGHYTAELLRLKGEALLGLSAANAGAAEACFRQALAVSHQQRAKALELRAAMSMARLWQSQGKTTEAQVLLTGVYGRFTEGFDSYDVREAKALIGNLAPNAGTVCARAC